MLTLRRARRALALLALTSQAWLALAAVDLALLAGFAEVHTRVRRRHVRRTRGEGTLTEQDVVWAVDEACVWYVKRAACLQRSVAATWLLRRYGFAAELVIGYRPIPFESHAWVEVNGLVVNDRPQYQKAFTVLDRL